MNNPITKGSPTFKLDAGLAVARVGDPISCTGETAIITKGADTITVDGQPIAHLQSKIDHGGVMKQGSPTAFVSPRQPINIHTVKTQPPQKLDPKDFKDIIYITGDNKFYALTVEDADELEAAAKTLMGSLQALWNATNSHVHDEPTIVAAKQDLNNTMTIENVVNSPDDIEITEITHFIGSKRTYVPTSKMKNKWKLSQIDKDIQVDNLSSKIRLFLEKMKDPDNPKRISGKNVKNAIAKVSGGSAVDIKIAEVDWSSTYKDFQTYVGGDHFDASAQAQLLRACAGGSMTGAWSPQKGKFSFSADGQATLDLAQGQLSTTSYIPSVQGFSLKVNLPNKEGQTRPLDLGAIRSALTLTAQGFLGASIAAGANLNMTITPDGSNNKLQANGNHEPKPSSTGAKADPDKNGLMTEANAFAGVKAGGDIGANIAWQNPEYKTSVSASDDDSWTEFAALDGGGSASLGLGAGLEFSIGYEPTSGKFYIRAMANAVCGPGLSGDIGYVIEPKHIWEFVMFVYHKIKDQHFSFVGFLATEAIKALVNLSTQLVCEVGAELSDLAKQTENALNTWLATFIQKLEAPDTQLNTAITIANNLNHSTNAECIKYSLCEVKGRLLYILSDPALIDTIQSNAEHKKLSTLYVGSYEVDLEVQKQIQTLEDAMLVILSYIQSQPDYINVMQHMSPNSLDPQDKSIGEQRLYNGLGVYGRSQLKKLHQFKEMIDDEQNEIVYPDTLPINTPVKQNIGVIAL